MNLGPIIQPVTPVQRPRLPEVQKQKPKIGGDEPKCPEVCSGTKDVDCKSILIGYTKVRREKVMPDGTKQEYEEDHPVYETQCKKVPDCKEVCPKKPKIGGDKEQCPEVCSGTKDVDCKSVLIGYSKLRREKFMPDGTKQEYEEDYPVYETQCKKVPDCQEVCR